MTITIKDLLAYDDYLDGLKALKEDKDINYLITSYFEPVEDLSTLDEDQLKQYSNNITLIAEYGFDLTDTWNFNITILRFILPRLYVLYKTDYSLSQQYEEGTWGEILESILEYILLQIKSDPELDNLIPTYTKGKTLLFKYFNRLWN